MAKIAESQRRRASLKAQSLPGIDSGAELHFFVERQGELSGARGFVSPINDVSRFQSGTRVFFRVFSG
jgi:hypothetical protein